MALTAIGQVRFGALADLPPMPQHYHVEAMRDTPNGVRVDVHFKGALQFLDTTGFTAPFKASYGYGVATEIGIFTQALPEWCMTTTRGSGPSTNQARGSSTRIYQR